MPPFRTSWLHWAVHWGSHLDRRPKGCIPENTPAGRRLGFDLTADKGPVTFNAFDSFHFTRAWKGNRLVPVAYTTDRLDALGKQDIHRLQELGFRLPARSWRLLRQMQPSSQYNPSGLLPPEVEWKGRSEPIITDGFGLLTHQAQTERLRELIEQRRPCALSIASARLRFPKKHVLDPRALCQKLERGELESSPFEESAMHRVTPALVHACRRQRLETPCIHSIATDPIIAARPSTPSSSWRSFGRRNWGGWPPPP